MKTYKTIDPYGKDINKSAQPPREIMIGDVVETAYGGAVVLDTTPEICPKYVQIRYDDGDIGEVEPGSFVFMNRANGSTK